MKNLSAIAPLSSATDSDDDRPLVIYTNRRQKAVLSDSSENSSKSKKRKRRIQIEKARKTLIESDSDEEEAAYSTYHGSPQTTGSQMLTANLSPDFDRRRQEDMQEEQGMESDKCGKNLFRTSMFYNKRGSKRRLLIGKQTMSMQNHFSKEHQKDILAVYDFPDDENENEPLNLSFREKSDHQRKENGKRIPLEKEIDDAVSRFEEGSAEPVNLTMTSLMHTEVTRSQNDIGTIATPRSKPQLHTRVPTHSTPATRRNKDHAVPSTSCDLPTITQHSPIRAATPMNQQCTTATINMQEVSTQTTERFISQADFDAVLQRIAVLERLGEGQQRAAVEDVVKVPKYIRKQVRKGYKAGILRNKHWGFGRGRTYCDDGNQALTAYINGFVRGSSTEEMNAEHIAIATETYFRTKSANRDPDVYNLQQRGRSRRTAKADRRKRALAEAIRTNKYSAEEGKKIEDVLKPCYMSDEEDEVDEDGTINRKMFVVRPLHWQTEEFGNIKTELDKIYMSIAKEFGLDQMKIRKVGLTSYAPIPKIPVRSRWIIKTSLIQNA